MGTLRQGYNDLLTWCNENGSRGQLLIDEWNQDKNYNEYEMPVVMQEVSYSHHRNKFWWTCKRCGNDFQMSPASRTIQGQGCPICGHKRGGVKNHQSALKDGNDLYSWCKENGRFGKLLMEEWDTRKNMDLLRIGIADVSAGCGNKVYWICSRCGENFEASVSHRTICGSGCPHCNKKATSLPEQIIYHSLKQIFPDTISRGKAFGKIEYDICIPSQKFCIEYNGQYWHKDKKERDDKKEQICSKYNVRLIQIYGCNTGDECEVSGNKIRYRISYSRHLEQLRKIIGIILDILGHSIEEIIFDKAADNAYKAMYDEVENNISVTYPELLKEWDYDLNGTMKPEQFTAGSRQMVNWKCKNCKNSWKVSVKSRTMFKTGCSCCGYNIFDGKIHKSAINKRKVILPGQFSL